MGQCTDEWTSLIFQFHHQLPCFVAFHGNLPLLYSVCRYQPVRWRHCRFPIRNDVPTENDLVCDIMDHYEVTMNIRWPICQLYGILQQ